MPSAHSVAAFGANLCDLLAATRRPPDFRCSYPGGWPDSVAYQGRRRAHPLPKA